MNADDLTSGLCDASRAQSPFTEPGQHAIAPGKIFQHDWAMTDAPHQAPAPRTGKASLDAFAAGAAAYAAGQYTEAARFFAICTQQSPQHHGAWLNLGSALRRLGQLDAAVCAGRRAVALVRDHPGSMTNLGNTLVDASQIAEGLALQRRAHGLVPQDPLIRRNLAVALREACLYAEALQHFEHLLAAAPEDKQLAWECALCLLYMGDYKRGWPAFEARWHLPAMTARWPQIARWQGEDLIGRRILLTEEQGFGDTILCSRYLPDIIRRVGGAGRVTLACKKPLHPLLRGIGGLTLRTIEDAEREIANDAASYDLQAAMMSLPGIFKTDLDRIPAPAPLQAAGVLPARVQAALDQARGRFKIGIVWSGSVTFGNNRKRSMSAERMAQLAAIENVEVYSLQKGPREDDLHASGMQHIIHEIGPQLNDFSETAAVLKQLDLVIMTDSSVAHLAGSLGVPVWNLLHDCPYWLYLQERRDTPWYPSMRLYRQTTPGDWDAVMEQVKADLDGLARQGRD